MSGPTLLVSGSRALADTPASRAWTARKLAAAMLAFEPRSVVHGGARGADEIAHATARLLGITVVCFALDGGIYKNGAPLLDGEGELRRWADDATMKLPRDRLPLSRNRAMVSAIARGDARPRACLVLVAAWRTTDGGLHTGTHASRAGIESWCDECPMEYRR